MNQRLILISHGRNPLEKLKGSGIGVGIIKNGNYESITVRRGVRDGAVSKGARLGYNRRLGWIKQRREMRIKVLEIRDLGIKD